MHGCVLIVGASARAAAQSAQRANLCPLAVDRFADADLAVCCPVRRLERYPAELLKLVSENTSQHWPQPPDGWMYVGALENRPQLIARLATRLPLLGNGSEVLRRVRSVNLLAKVLTEGGFHFPATFIDAEAATHTGKWLCKPLHSAGGHGIRWRSDRIAQPPRGHCVQQWIDGLPCSAVYVAGGGQCRLIGLAQQLVGLSWAAATEFQYAGSIGPLLVSDKVRNEFERLGEHLAHAFGLRGLFGVDAVLQGDEVWTLEVNPRYTASVEILERVTCVSALAAHWSACCEDALPAEIDTKNNNVSNWGKAILFAPRDFMVPHEFSAYVQQQNAQRSWPLVADVPAIGTTISRGAPITTVFANGRDKVAVLAALHKRADEVWQSLSISDR